MGCGICSARIVELLKGSVQKVVCDHPVAHSDARLSW